MNGFEINRDRDDKYSKGFSDGAKCERVRLVIDLENLMIRKLVATPTTESYVPIKTLGKFVEYLRESKDNISDAATVAITFKDKETANSVFLISRRKGIDLADYIVDNFEWDMKLECIDTKKITKGTCEGCDWIETCPDGVK